MTEEVLSIKESKTLLKEIEEPTESLVTEGIFSAMLVHRESRPATQREVTYAMYMLDDIDPEDDVEGRINRAILNGTVAVRWDDRMNDFLLFPSDVREWWKVTLRYLINYMEKITLADQLPDKYHLTLIKAVNPHMGKMVATNQLPTCFPWESP